MAVKVRKLVDRGRKKTPSIKDINPQALKNMRKYKSGDYQYLVWDLRDGMKPYPSEYADWQDVNKSLPFSIPTKKVKKKKGRERRCTLCGSRFNRSSGCISCSNDSWLRSEVRDVYKNVTRIDEEKLVKKIYNLKLDDTYGRDGYYQVYEIGGRNPPLKYHLKAWIHRAEKIGEVDLEDIRRAKA